MAAPLEFLFSIDAKLDGLMKLLEETEKSVEALHKLDHATEGAVHATEHAEKASHHAASAHEKHGHAVWQLGHQYEYVKNGIHEFAEALGLVLAYEVIEKLVDKVVELGEEIVNAAAKAERAEKSFKLLLGAEGGDELLEYLEDITKHTEFTNEKLQGTAASLLRVGFAGEGLHRALAAALDISALPGGNLDEALSSIERLKRTGRVDNRTLGGIGFGEKDFLEQLSKRTGSPAAVLKQEMEKGKLDVDEALESLYDLIHKRTGKALGAAGVAMSETLGARLTHLKDAPEEIFKTLSKGEAFEKLSARIGKLSEMLNPSGEVGGKLAKTLGVLFTKAVDFVEHVDFEKVGAQVIDFLDKLPGRFETAIEVLDVFVAVFKLVGETFNIVGEFIGDAAAEIFLEVEQLAEYFDKIGTFIGEVAAKLYLGAVDIGTKLWQGLKEGITGGITYVMDAVSNMGDAVVGKLKGVLGIHSPSTVFAGLGEMSGEGYLQGLDEAMGRMSDSVPAGAFARPVAGGAAAGPIQVTIHIETHVGGGGAGGATAAEIGEQVATHVEAILPGALQAAFEQMQIEAGA